MRPSWRDSKVVSAFLLLLTKSIQSTCRLIPTIKEYFAGLAKAAEYGRPVNETIDECHSDHEEDKVVTTTTTVTETKTLVVQAKAEAESKVKSGCAAATTSTKTVAKTETVGKGKVLLPLSDHNSLCVGLRVHTKSDVLVKVAGRLKGDDANSINHI
ncbi:hypothetical protein BKA70DRAFT_1256001 [Coprinopsis sp. MPI-PUGE-AT-0042]|nr:hypothetical protein BKA70DRAFT_1256001 [Coprinopsis sp. MPI-PUGE-AT-0042]